MKGLRFVRSVTALALVFSMAACMLSCGNGDESTEGRTDTETVAEAEVIGDKLNFVENGESQYTIVWKSRAKGAEQSAPSVLRAAIAEATGVSLTMKTDIISPQEFSETKKIVVGRVDYDDMKSEWSELGENDYVIKTVGSDIYILGGSAKAVYAAMLKFKNQFVISGEQTLSISSDYNYIFDGADSREDYIEDPFTLIPDWVDQLEVSEAMLDFSEKKESLEDPDGRLMSFAHRGDSEHYPENSIEGIISCVQMGVDIIEIDVRLSKDGVAVLMHDADGNLTRTTNYSDVKGTTVNGMTLPTSPNVGDWTLEQLRCLRLKSGHGGTDAKLTDYTVPTLEEVIKVTNGRCFIVCDKFDSLDDYTDVAFPIMKKLGAYDTLVLRGGVSDSSAVYLQNIIKNQSDNPEKKYPIYIGSLSISKASSWATTISSYEKMGLSPIFVTSGLTDTNSDMNQVLKNNEAAFLAVKGTARLNIGVYSQNSVFETAEIYDKCLDMGINMVLVNKPLGSQKYISEKYFNK